MRFSITLVICLVLSACGNTADDPTEVAAADTTPQIETEAPSTDAIQESDLGADDIESLRVENQRLQEELQNQILATMSCETDLALATAEGERYRQGLDKAVAQLNRSAGRTATPPRRAPAPAPKRDPGRISSRIGPKIQIVGSSVYAYGELWSYRDVDTHVQLTLELLADDRSVATDTIRMLVPANTNTSYRHEFRILVDSKDHYRAQARLSY